MRNLGKPAVNDAVGRFQISVVSDFTCMQKGHAPHYVINQGYPEIQKVNLGNYFLNKFQMANLKSVSSSKSLSSRISCSEPLGQYSVIIKEKPGGKRQTHLVSSQFNCKTDISITSSSLLA